MHDLSWPDKTAGLSRGTKRHDICHKLYLTSKLVVIGIAQTAHGKTPKYRSSIP
jgi:hypothetical protein